MSKYFYYVSHKNSYETGSIEYDEYFVGQNRELARKLKRDSYSKSAKIHKFERAYPYKYLGVVS